MSTGESFVGPHQTTVRNNLMTREGYSPYCGSDKCFWHWPRTRFNGEQFTCICGYVTQFPRNFIKAYKERWK